MGVSTQQILAPKTILHAVSQMALPGTTLQRLFGWGFSGAKRRAAVGPQLFVRHLRQFPSRGHRPRAGAGFESAGAAQGGQRARARSRGRRRRSRCSMKTCSTAGPSAVGPTSSIWAASRTSRGRKRTWPSGSPTWWSSKPRPCCAGRTSYQRRWRRAAARLLRRHAHGRFPDPAATRTQLDMLGDRRHSRCRLGHRRHRYSAAPAEHQRRHAAAHRHGPGTCRAHQRRLAVHPQQHQGAGDGRLHATWCSNRCSAPRPASSKPCCGRCRGSRSTSSITAWKSGTAPARRSPSSCPTTHAAFFPAALAALGAIPGRFGDRHRRTRRAAGRAVRLLPVRLSHARSQRLGTVGRDERHPRAVHAVGGGLRPDHRRSVLGA